MTYRSVLPIWWSFTWRSLLAGVIAGIVLGFVAGFAFALMGRPDLGAPVSGVLGFIGGLAASVWGMRSALIANSVTLSA